MKRPPTKYAHSGDASIAYQVMGEGPIDLIVNGRPATHLDLQWEEPLTARTFERFASFSRLIRFDRRGTGLSDPVQSPPTLEQQMDDMRAVKEALGVERVALLGGTDAGLTAMYAATYPDEVASLVLSGVSTSAAPAHPERTEELLDIIENAWGEGRLLPLFAPSKVGDRQFEEWWARYERGSVTRRWRESSSSSTCRWTCAVSCPRSRRRRWWSTARTTSWCRWSGRRRRT